MPASFLDRESDVLAGELAVDAREGLQLVLEAGSVLRVEGAADQLAAVGSNAGALGSDLGGEDEVLEDGVVHGSERAAAGPGLLSAAVGARLGQDTALANEHDLVVRELLLELTG